VLPLACKTHYLYVRIVDALSVGCIPVFFDDRQDKLWPLWWNASITSINFRWRVSIPPMSEAFNSTAMTERWEGLLPNATRALDHLLQMPPEQVDANISYRTSLLIP
jgi:hypothetical protein